MNKLQPNELRVGNLVTDEFYPDFERIITVESIGEKGINLSASDDNAPYGMHNGIIEYDMLFESLRGIPLSEEWLIKLGFEPNGVFKSMRLPVDELTKFGTRSFIVVAHDSETWIELIERNVHDKYTELQTGMLQSCKYVHQLQNLYFALTGTELTVTESEPPNRE
jgi:hypothetical protein